MTTLKENQLEKRDVRIIANLCRSLTALIKIENTQKEDIMIGQRAR